MSLRRAAAASLPNSLPLHTQPNALTPTPLPASAEGSKSALRLLASQPSHYITALILGRRYQLTPNDVLTVPHMKGVKAGDRIALTRILEIGSRDYTLRAMPPANGATASSSSEAILSSTNAQPGNAVNGPLTARLALKDGIPRDWQRHPDSLPYFSNGEVACEMTVLEHTKGKMFTVDKFKRRKGYRRTLRSKLEFTKLRVGDIIVGGGV
ncbi:hypothetical protein OIV83_003059 [Microbotryomycetes sp. JL201]|nr:hypothetical protein OIV83_003059 [Microbotryomycetes sp. JL201]